MSTRTRDYLETGFYLLVIAAAWYWLVIRG
jgi:hypothetical protein